MNTSARSLRSLIDKWLAPTATTLIHVTRSHPVGAQDRRYVRVETRRQNNTVSMFFFRHDDGWCVFPPTIRRVSLGSHLHVATR